MTQAPIYGIGGGIMQDVATHMRDDAGQTMAEYAVVLGVITIAVVVTLGLLAGQISAVLATSSARYSSRRTDATRRRFYGSPAWCRIGTAS